jgi:oligosaccharide repeat unit polymerase
MTWIFLAVLAGTILSTLAFRQDLFSPGRVYLAIYSLLLAINSLHLSRIQVPWNFSTRIFFYGASFMFVGGTILIGLACKTKFPNWRLDFGAVKRALALDAAGMDWRWFQRVWLACTGIFLASYLVSYFVIGEIPVFSEVPEKARLAFSVATVPTYYGLYFGPFSLMLAVEMIMFGGFGARKLIPVYLALGLVLVLYMTIITRFDIFRFVIFCAVLFHYGKQNLKFSHLIIVFTAILVVFFSASLIRINEDAMGALTETIKVKLPQNIAWASGFYAYLANDFWNMNYGFEKYAEGAYYHPLSMGMGMLRAVTSYLLNIETGLISTFGYDTVMNPKVELIQGLNTVVYVWHLWKDFGAFGVFLVPLLGGLLLAKFHLNSLFKPTLFRFSMWGCLVAIVILSFHFPIWELWFFHVNLLIIAIAHRKLTLLGGPGRRAFSSPSPGAPVSGPKPSIP